MKMIFNKMKLNKEIYNTMILIIIKLLKYKLIQEDIYLEKI